MYFIQDSNEVFQNFKKNVLSEIFSNSTDYDIDSKEFIKRFLCSDFAESMERSDGSRYWLMSPQYTLGSFLDENKIPKGKKYRKDEMYFLGGKYFELIKNENAKLASKYEPRKI